MLASSRGAGKHARGGTHSYTTRSLALDKVAVASGAVHPLEPMGYLCLQAVISDTSMSKRSTGALVGRRPSVGSPYRTPTRWEAGKKWMKRQQDGMAVDHHAHHPARGAAPVPFGRARAKHPGGAGRPCAACPRAASACAPSPSPVRAWLPMGVNVHDARGGNRDCPRRARGCAGVAQWSFSGSDRPLGQRRWPRVRCALFNAP